MRSQACACVGRSVCGFQLCSWAYVWGPCLGGIYHLQSLSAHACTQPGCTPTVRAALLWC
jgi:hypothetical protein